MKPVVQLRIAPEPDPELARLVITEVVSQQPVPWSTEVIVSPDGNFTVITRHFRDGNHRRCKLCPKGKCVFRELVGSCQIGTNGRISIDEAELFDANGVDYIWPVAR